MLSTERPPTPSDHVGASDAAVATARGQVARPTPELAHAIKRGYEVKDISLRGLFIFLGSLVVSLVIVLFLIYGIMAALTDREQHREQLGATVTALRPPVYAPLQPSSEHQTEDWEDMNMMRRQTQALLSSAGVTPTGRRYIPITLAINQVIDKLVIAEHPIQQPQLPVYPVGSIEGVYTGGPDGGTALRPYETGETKPATQPIH